MEVLSYLPSKHFFLHSNTPPFAIIISPSLMLLCTYYVYRCIFVDTRSMSLKEARKMWKSKCCRKLFCQMKNDCYSFMYLNKLCCCECYTFQYRLLQIMNNICQRHIRTKKEEKKKRTIY